MTDINHKPTPLDIYPSVAHEDIDLTPVKKENDLPLSLQGVNEVKNSPSASSKYSETSCFEESNVKIGENLILK